MFYICFHIFINSISIILLGLVFIHHVKSSRIIKKSENSSDEVYVLRVMKDFDAYSMRIFSSKEIMQSYMNNHPLSEGFRYDIEPVICNPID